MNPYEDKLYVGTRAGVPAIINGTDDCICVATITAFPWDPTCTAPEDYARMFAAAPMMLKALQAAQHALRCISKTARDNDSELTLIRAAIAKATRGATASGKTCYDRGQS